MPADAIPKTARRPPAARRPAVDPARCTGCGRCVAACGPQVLSLAVVRWRKTAALHDPGGCTGCRLCERACPFDAIAMVRTGSAVDAPGAPGAANTAVSDCAARGGGAACGPAPRA